MKQCITFLVDKDTYDPWATVNIFYGKWLMRSDNPQMSTHGKMISATSCLDFRIYTTENQ